MPKIIKHKLNEELAIKLLGWKWIAFDGIPIRTAPGYPDQCRVRELFSPEEQASKGWQDFFAEHNASDATGDEPLSYAYCSSSGPGRVPQFLIIALD
jgi:hypothetical protein